MIISVKRPKQPPRKARGLSETNTGRAGNWVDVFLVGLHHEDAKTRIWHSQIPQRARGTPRDVSPELPPRSQRFAIPPPSGIAILLAVGVPPPTTSPCVVSFPQLRTRLTQYFVAEGIRSYTLGVCGVVSAVPEGANPPILRVHFVPLRRFLAFMQIAADSQQTFRFRAGYRVWGGRTGRSPCLTAKSEGLSVASIVFQALKALNSTCTFQIAPRGAHLQV